MKKLLLSLFQKSVPAPDKEIIENILDPEGRMKVELKLLLCLIGEPEHERLKEGQEIIFSLTEPPANYPTIRLILMEGNDADWSMVMKVFQEIGKQFSYTLEVFPCWVDSSTEYFISIQYAPDDDFIDFQDDKKEKPVPLVAKAMAAKAGGSGK